jgi:hypothetical protein
MDIVKNHDIRAKGEKNLGNFVLRSIENDKNESVKI